MRNKYNDRLLIRSGIDNCVLNRTFVTDGDNKIVGFGRTDNASLLRIEPSLFHFIVFWTQNSETVEVHFLGI